MPPFKDTQASPPTCAVCNGDASNGYYDSHAERYYCDDGCFEDWADANSEVVTEFYKRLNLE